MIVLLELTANMAKDFFNPKQYKQFFTINLSQENYKRLTVPAGVWMAFKGIGEDLNMLLNLASIEHDPSEAISKELTHINYTWN